MKKDISQAFVTRSAKQSGGKRQSAMLKGLATLLVSLLCIYAINESSIFDTLLQYCLIASSLWVYMEVVPYIWTKDNIRLTINKMLFVGLVCLALLLPVLLIYLHSMHLLPTWAQWAFWVVQTAVAIGLQLCQKYSTAKR